MTQAPLHWQATQLRDRQLGPAAADWDALLQRTWGQHPLLDSRFVNCLLDQFGTGAEHLCVGADEAGLPLAMHVLTRRSATLWTSFIPMQAPIGMCLSKGPVDMATLLKALPGFATQLDVLSYDNRFGDFGCNRPQPNTTWHSLTTSIHLAGGFETYWAMRSNKLRQDMLRYERKLAELGTARLAVLRAPEEMQAAVDRCAAIESAEWTGREGTALALGSTQTAFYGDVMASFADSGAAEAYELWVGDRHLASRLSVNTGGVIVMLKTSFNERHAQSDPGLILLARTIEHAFEQHPGKCIEFYTNAIADQRMWSTSEHPIRHATFHRHPAWAVASMLARSTRGAAAVSMRRAPDTALQRLKVSMTSQVAELSPAAISLMEHAERHHGPCAGADWYRNLCAQVPDLGQQARFAVLQRDEQPIAVLPLRIETSPWAASAKISALANYYTSLYTPAFDDSLTSGELAVLLRGAQALLGKASEIRFNPMDPHSREYTLLRAALLTTGCVISPFFCFGNWTHRPRARFDDYMAQRPGAVRTSHKRMPKRFAAAGGTLEIVTGGDRLPAALDAYQHVYEASWKKPEPYLGFMPGLIRICAQRGWLRLGIAWLGEQPIAAQVWIVAHGRAEIYKLAYDEAFKSHAAGTVLTAHLMRHAMDEDRVSEIDYLIGDDDYKKSWMDHRQERWGLVAYSPLTLRGMAGSLRTAVRMLSGPWRAVEAPSAGQLHSTTTRAAGEN